jgi:hypothetical protein
MLTIPCPSCKRPLHLPETEQGNIACCPLCKTIFQTPSRLVDVPGASRDYLASSLMYATRSGLPSPGESASVEDPYDAADEKTDSRRSLQSASRFLVAYVVLAGIQTLTCGFLNASAVVDLFGYRYDGPFVFAVVAVQVIALFVILCGAGTMARGRTHHVAIVGCTLALALSVFQFLMPLSHLVAYLTPFGRWVPYAEWYWGVSTLVSGVLAVIGWLGGIRGWIILHFPEKVR